jgi:hypothetical protein
MPLVWSLQLAAVVKESFTAADSWANLVYLGLE